MKIGIQGVDDESVADMTEYCVTRMFRIDESSGLAVEGLPGNCMNHVVTHGCEVDRHAGPSGALARVILACDLRMMKVDYY